MSEWRMSECFQANLSIPLQVNSSVAQNGQRVPPPLSQQVYLTLRNTLMAGRLRPGESVSLRTLAKRLGTSAMPVREAVNRLIAEKALQLLPSRQIIVPRMTRAKFAELSSLRQTLEGLAAKAACKHIGEAQIRELEALNESLIEAIADDDTINTLELNKSFHFALYSAGRSEILLPLIEGLWMQAGPFLHLSLSQQKWHWTNKQHLVILDALRRGDRAAVVTAIRRDIRDTAELLIANGSFDD
jgi:DNA-binding GntR family transcriptional regulator